MYHLQQLSWLGAGLGALAWLVALVIRRVAAARRSSLPVWNLTGRLITDGIALPMLLFVAGPQAAWVPLLAVGIALAVWTFAPGYVASKIIPLTLIGIGLNGFLVARDYARGEFWGRHYGLAGASYTTFPNLVLAQAYLFLAAGLWLAWRRLDPQSPLRQWVLRVERGAVAGRPRWGLLLLPLVGMSTELAGRTFWLGFSWWSAGMTFVVGLAAVVLVIRFPAVAADLTLAGLVLFGLYGIAIAADWPSRVPLPSPYTIDVRIGLIWVDSRSLALLAGVQGLALIGFALWLLPRTVDDHTRALFRSATDAELAGRVIRLTRTRADAVDTATEQIRRLERDLHDGAQARLVALGMSLGAAERLIPSNPQAAVALVAEARATSVKVLAELRDLVRGICPPVLADRGLADAVRALALDTPLRATVDIDLPGRPDLPVETACYFAVAKSVTWSTRMTMP